jgi:hypothetical protein
VSFFQSKLECLSGKRTPKPIFFRALDERRDRSMRFDRRRRKSVRTEVPPPPDVSSFARAAVRHTWTRGDVTERTSVATELRRRPSVLGLRAARERVNRR